MQQNMTNFIFLIDNWLTNDDQITLDLPKKERKAASCKHNKNPLR